MKFKCLLPSMVTSLSLISGLYALVQIADKNFVLAAWLIACSMIFDSLDGKLARALGAQSMIGAEIDSLADFVAFGVVPAFLAYQVFLNQFGILGMFVALFYVMSGGYRLARFNTELTDLDTKEGFSGLPIPSAAWFISAFIVFQYAYWGRVYFNQFFLFAMIFISLLMTSHIEFPSNFRDYFPTKVGKLFKYSFIVSLIFMIQYSAVVYLFWNIFYIVVSITRHFYLVTHQEEHYEIKN